MSKRTAINLVLQSGLALGLMFFGWGFGDWRGFLADPARAAFVGLAVAGVGVALALRLDLNMFRRGRRPVGAQRWRLMGVSLAAIFLVWFFPYADRRGVLTFSGAAWLRWAGFLLYAGGSVILVAALKALGKQYSGYITIQDEHRLVQHGIYGVIRHPIYLRALMVSVGLPLVFRSWLVVALIPLIVLFIAPRIRSEERLLAEEFGEEFEAYRRRTWRLLPYVY